VARKQKVFILNFMLASATASVSLLWSWNWQDFVGLLMVFIGVMGALVVRLISFRKFSYDENDLMPIEFWKKQWELKKVGFEIKKKWWDFGFECVLVIGLALEIFALPKQISEIERLHASNLALRKQVEQFRSDNLGLEKQVNETKTQLANAEARLIELQVENLPMDIGEQYSLAQALKPLAGMQVELRIAFDSKAQRTAELLSSAFALAEWPIINRSFIGDIGEEGVVIGYNGDDPSVKAAHLLLKQLTDRNVPSEFAFSVRGVPTNAIIVAIMQRPSKLKSNLMIVQAKETELRDQSPKIMTRIMELASEKFVPGSKELENAQAEFNSLNLKYAQVSQEQEVLSKNEINLWKEIAKEESGTNSMTPGIHMYNSTIFNGGLPGMIVGTNSTVIFHGVKFNAPPLQ